MTIHLHSVTILPAHKRSDVRVRTKAYRETHEALRRQVEAERKGKKRKGANGAHPHN